MNLNFMIRKREENVPWIIRIFSPIFSSLVAISLIRNPWSLWLMANGDIRFINSWIMCSSAEIDDFGRRLWSPQKINVERLVKNIFLWMMKYKNISCGSPSGGSMVRLIKSMAIKI